jgi:hypothetical protein
LFFLRVTLIELEAIEIADQRAKEADNYSVQNYHGGIKKNERRRIWRCPPQQAEQPELDRPGPRRHLGALITVTYTEKLPTL